MKKIFEYSDDKSNKFWSIETNGNEFTVVFGKTGTDGQSQTKSFADSETCEKEAEKLIREKTKKGYVEQAEMSVNEKICSLPFMENTLKKLHNALKDSETLEEIGEEPCAYLELFPDIYEEWEEPENLETDDECDEPMPLERGFWEDILAIEAVKYPQLHAIMEKIVLRLTKFGEENDAIWGTEESVAGSGFARELAIADKKYIPLNYRFLLTNDMNHEVYQTDDIWLVCKKWDFAPETYPLIVFRAGCSCGGQHLVNMFPTNKRMTPAEAQLYFDTVLKGIEDTKPYWRFSETDDLGKYEVWSLKLLFEPFCQSFDLNEQQHSAFALAFNNAMANKVKPVLDDLLIRQ